MDANKTAAATASKEADTLATTNSAVGLTDNVVFYMSFGT